MVRDFTTSITFVHVYTVSFSRSKISNLCWYILGNLGQNILLYKKYSIEINAIVDANIQLSGALYTQVQNIVQTSDFEITFISSQSTTIICEIFVTC